jgi:small subunit ribosomal protein S21
MYSNQQTRKDIHLEVTVRKNDVAKAMRILKKKLEREGVLQELRQREYYEKPSAKKRREKKANINRTKKMAKERIREENSPST